MKMFAMKLLVSFGVVLGTFFFTTQIPADDITFSAFSDSADWPWIGRSFDPGVFEGVIHGLVDNATSTPTGVTLFGDYSSLGMSSNVISSWDITVGAGITLSGGVVTAADFLGNFTDPSSGDMQLRFNFDSTEARNVIHWNGGSGPVAGRGNANGFGGVTYGVIPEPSSTALLGVCLIGAWMRRRKK